MLTASLRLATAIYFEARGQPLVGQIAVAQVVMNRTKDKRWPSTVCGVVRQPNQFSFYWDAVPDTPGDERAFARARMVAQWALEGALPDVVDGAKWYAHHGVRRVWMRGLRGKRIGDHVFYREGK